MLDVQGSFSNEKLLQDQLSIYATRHIYILALLYLAFETMSLDVDAVGLPKNNHPRRVEGTFLAREEDSQCFDFSSLWNTSRKLLTISSMKLLEWNLSGNQITIKVDGAKFLCWPLVYFRLPLQIIKYLLEWKLYHQCWLIRIEHVNWLQWILIPSGLVEWTVQLVEMDDS